MNIAGSFLSLIVGIANLFANKIFGDIIRIIQGQALESIANCSNLIVNSSLISFHVYTFENDTPSEYSGTDEELHLNSSRITKFLIHGWMDTSKRPWLRKTANAYFKNGHQYNVVAVDWSAYSSSAYSEAQCYVPSVGKTLANFVNKSKLQPEKVHLIGHSLGAHIAGYAGQYMKDAKIDRITGLDPAGPLFCFPTLVNENHRLSADDANFVDVIHTNDGQFGCRNELGAVDFRPNCGSYQKGCTAYNVMNITVDPDAFLKLVFCSHTRSVEYYMESINNNCFSSIKCTSCAIFRFGLCGRNEQNYMGENSLRNVTGEYHTKTNSQTPYCHL